MAPRNGRDPRDIHCPVADDWTEYSLQGRHAMQRISNMGAQMDVISQHVPALSQLPALLQNINRSMDQGNRMNIALMIGLMIIVVVALLRERNFEMSHERIKVGQVQMEVPK